MTTKKVFIIVLMAIICLYTSSCQAKSSLELYKAYVCDVPHDYMDSDYGDIVYNEPTNSYSLPSKTTSVKNDLSDKKIALGSDLISMEYNCTYNKDYCEYLVDSYSNGTYNIKASYREDDGSLEYLRLGDYKYRISDNEIKSEEDLLRICKEYLLTHVENLDKYTATITTQIQTIDENGLDNNTTDGFVIAKENSGTTIYEVNYAGHIGGIKTSEGISISVTSSGYLKTVSFNMIGAFDRFSNCNINMDLCNQMIESEINSLCDIDHYEFEGYTDTKILIIIKDQLCVLSYVKPSFKGTNETENVLASAIQLLIPVSD